MPEPSEIDRTKVKHRPDERCATNAHCWSHNVDELDQPGDYRVCGECWHIFRTEEDLLQANKDLLEAMRIATPKHLRYQVPVPEASGERIYSCPFCTHDF